jgi:hypothetical protein
MYVEMIVALEQQVKELKDRLAERENQDIVETLDYLDEMDFLKQIGSENEQMLRLRRELRAGTTCDWLIAFEDELATAAYLKSFVLEVYANHFTPSFDMKGIIERWSNLEPDMRVAIAWLASRCSRFRQYHEAKRPRPESPFATESGGVSVTPSGPDK